MDKQKNIPQLRFPEYHGVWERKKIKDLVEIKYGKDQKQIASIDGKYPIMGTGGEMGRTNVFLYDKPSVMIGRKGTIDKPRFMDTPFWTVDTLFYTEVFNNTDPKWLYYKFETINWYLYNEASGVPSLSSSTIYSIPIKTPSLPEQQKIASFFTAIDQKISQLKRKETLLEQYKKGVMQKIFSQQIRFKDDNGQEFPKWERKKLSEYLYVSKNKNFDGKYGKEDVLSVSGDYGIVNQMEFQGRSFAGESVLNYGRVETGDIVYTKSPLKNNPYGIIKVNKGKVGIVSTLYAVYKCKDNAVGEYFDYYFQLDEKLNGYLRPLVHKGAKNDMKINNERVLIDTLSVPCKKEQYKIVVFFNAIDEKINHTQKQIEKAENWKKGLMQQMFV